MRFTRHIGIDYSGAKTPESQLKGLRVYEAKAGPPTHPRRSATPSVKSVAGGAETAPWRADRWQ